MRCVALSKARYQRGHSAQYSGFKVATSMFVLFILELVFIILAMRDFIGLEIVDVRLYFPTEE